MSSRTVTTRLKILIPSLSNLKISSGILISVCVYFFFFYERDRGRRKFLVTYKRPARCFCWNRREIRGKIFCAEIRTHARIGTSRSRTNKIGTYSVSRACCWPDSAAGSRAVAAAASSGPRSLWFVGKCRPPRSLLALSPRCRGTWFLKQEISKSDTKGIRAGRVSLIARPSRPYHKCMYTGSECIRERSSVREV